MVRLFYAKAFFQTRFKKEKALEQFCSKAFLMPLAGLEPARCYPLDFESSASANSATAAQN